MGTGYYPDLEEAHRLASDLETKSPAKLKLARPAIVLRALADELARHRSAAGFAEKEEELEKLRGENARLRTLAGDLGERGASAELGPSARVRHSEV